MNSEEAKRNRQIVFTGIGGVGFLFIYLFFEYFILILFRLVEISLLLFLVSLLVKNHTKPKQRVVRII